ncbi:MAG TPA: hypothetical protein VHA80_11750 [Solirubrobacterales bacterium]|nr:hypothetical protein [Solirubrobacterales bacterium]
MDEGDQKRQLIDGQTEGTGRLRGGVDRAHERVGRARLAVEDVGWFLRRHVAWPVEDSLERLGRRGAIGVFGGGGIAVAGVVAALVIAGSGGSSTSGGTTEAFVTPQRMPAPAPAAAPPAPRPKHESTEPSRPTLHGAPPDFSPAKDVRAGVANGKALGGTKGDGDEAPAKRGTADAADTGAAGADRAARGATAAEATTSSDDAPASTARIGATPAASASAQAQASSLAEASDTGAAETGQGGANGKGDEFTGPPAPKAAKKVARRFAEAFVVYEIGGIDTKVRKIFNQTSTKQLSRSLLHRPPRQPATVKVPRAKVVNVVAGPSKGRVYTVSVSLLRVGVTSELRLEMEQGVGKKWQVTNVLG